MWRYKSDPNPLYMCVIYAILNLSRKPVWSMAKKSIPGNCYNITQVLHYLKDLGLGHSAIINVNIGYGSNTLLWLDN